MNFVEKLTAATRENNSLLCVGLDPDPDKMPDKMGILQFNKAIIDATADLVCAYKPNFAFYEAAGYAGMDALKKTVEYIPKHIPIIADAKRGDIGNTAKAYAQAIFEYFQCDASTVSPFLGLDSVEPFLQYHDKGTILLCRTSNPGGGDFQSLKAEYQGKMRPVFEIVALKAQEWNTHGNIGLVVGATYPDELKSLRQAHPGLPFLIPGVGAQGGDVELTVRNGTNIRGELAIVNSSRQVLYASKGADFAQAARKVALETRDMMNKYRPTK